MKNIFHYEKPHTFYFPHFAIARPSFSLEKFLAWTHENWDYMAVKPAKIGQDSLSEVKCLWMKLLQEDCLAWKLRDWKWPNWNGTHKLEHLWRPLSYSQMDPESSLEGILIPKTVVKLTSKKMLFPVLPTKHNWNSLNILYKTNLRDSERWREEEDCLVTMEMAQW